MTKRKLIMAYVFAETEYDRKLFADMLNDYPY